MRQDAADLVIEHPDELTAARHLDPDQPIDRKAEGVLLRQRCDIVEPVEIRNGLEIGLGLDQLFDVAVQEADMRTMAASR